MELILVSYIKAKVHQEAGDQISTTDPHEDLSK